MNRALNRRTRKFLFQIATGAIIGAAVTLLLLSVARDVIEQSNGPELAAFCVGVCYALIGAFVTIGSAAPRLGANVLNVEDAEELTEMRGIILPSGLASMLIGGFLLALAFAAVDPGLEVSRSIILAVAALTLLGSMVFGVIVSRRMDELSRLVGAEAAMLALYISSILFAGWAALAQLGFVQWVEPLAFVAAIAAIQLLSAFIVVGKRGMLMPR